MTMTRVPDGDPSANASISIVGKDGKREHLADFSLEPDPAPGTVPPRVLDELRRCYREARDYTAALKEAIDAQAERYKIEPGALRKFVAALEKDDVADTRKESDDLLRLIESMGVAT